MVSEILISTASERSEAETCCAVDVEYYRTKTQVYKTLFSCPIKSWANVLAPAKYAGLA